MTRRCIPLTVLLFCFLFTSLVLKAQVVVIDSIKKDTTTKIQNLSKPSTDTIPSIRKLDTIIQNKKVLLSEQDSLIQQKQQALQLTNERIVSLSNNIQRLTRNAQSARDSASVIQKKIDSLNSSYEKAQTQANQLDTINKEKRRNLDSISTALDQQTIRLDISKKKNDSLQTEIKKSDTTLQQRESSIAKQLDSLETIAKIEMINRTAKVYKWTSQKDKHKLNDYEKPYRRDVLPNNNPPLDTIQQINISVKEGLILEVIAQTNHGIYRNSRSVVDLLHLGEKKKTMILFHEHQIYDPKTDSTCIFLDDIIRYTPIRSYYDVAYGDFDLVLSPTPDGQYYLLRESTSINTYFNVAAFTDIKGISGEPNGLAQFTAEAKFITNTRSFGTSAVVPFNYIAFQGGLAKFDSDFKGTELKNHDSISRKDLLQRANYSLGVKANLFKWFLSPKTLFLYDKVELNVGYNFLGTKVFDTLFKDAARTVVDTTTKSVTQNQWYIEPLISFSRHRNFSMCLALPFYFNSVKQNAITDFGIKNISTEIWAAPGISLMYFGKRDTGSKLFFRYNNYINLKNKTQSFTQMQLGYSINLTELWNGNGSK